MKNDRDTIFPEISGIPEMNWPKQSYDGRKQSDDSQKGIKLKSCVNFAELMWQLWNEL